MPLAENRQNRIAFVAHIFPSSPSGGMEAAALALVRGLAEYSHVTVFTASTDTPCMPNVSFERIPAANTDFLARRYCTFRRQWRRTAGDMDLRDSFDYVLTSAPNFGYFDASVMNFCSTYYLRNILLKRLLRGSVSPRLVHDICAQTAGAYHERAAIRDMVERRRSLLLPVSAGLRDIVTQLYGVPSEMIRVIPNSVDLSETDRDFTDKPDSQLMRMNEIRRQDGKIMLFAGHDWPRKGLDKAVKALALAPPHIHLAVAGCGSRKAVEGLARRLRVLDRIIFLGNRQDMYSVYNESDVFVLPSSFEALPLVCIEALASSLPLLLYPFPGSESIVTKETGHIVASPEQLAAKAVEITSSKAVHDAMRKSARSAAQAYGHKVIAKQVIQALESL